METMFQHHKRKGDPGDPPGPAQVFPWQGSEDPADGPMIPTRELGPGVSVGALGASFGVLNGRPWVVKDIQATAGRLADFGVTSLRPDPLGPRSFLPVLGALGEAGGPPRTISLGVGFEPPRYDDPISAGARANAFGTIDAGSGEGPNVPLQQRIDRFVSRAEKMLRGSVLDLVLVSLEEGREEELRRAFDRLEALTREGRLRAWGVSSGPDGPYQERIQMGVDAGADVVEVPYNLLDRGGIADLRSKGPGTPILSSWPIRSRRAASAARSWQRIAGYWPDRVHRHRSANSSVHWVPCSSSAS